MTRRGFLYGAIAAALLVALLAGVWAYALPQRGGEKAAAATVPGASYEGGEFVTNLADRDGRRYIKVRLEFELADPGVARELSKKNAQLRDQVLAVLRSRTWDDLAGEQGMSSLALDIKERVNSLLGSGKVTRVFFVEFVVQ